MTIYYYETFASHGEIKAVDDSAALKHLAEQFGVNLMCVYKESDTPDGTPFIMLYDVHNGISLKELIGSS
jgi:hypothetical protein